MKYTIKYKYILTENGQLTLWLLKILAKQIEHYFSQNGNSLLYIQCSSKALLKMSSDFEILCIIYMVRGRELVEQRKERVEA